MRCDFISRKKPNPKMKIIPLCLLTGAALLLAGCTGNLKLVEDGKIHPGTYDQVSNTLQIDIDGVPYKALSFKVQRQALALASQEPRWTATRISGHQVTLRLGNFSTA